MMRSIIGGLVLSIVIGCGSDAPQGGPSGPGGPATPTVGTAVNVNDSFFSPKNLQASAGQTVTWTWVGSQSHNVTFNDGPESGDKINGTFQRNFPATGTFSYSCTNHVGMTGSVVVVP
jgi:plastocyanin